MTRAPARRVAPPPLPSVDLDVLLKRLPLANARRVWRDLLVRAEQEEWTYEYLLTLLVTEEIAQRQQTRLGRLSRRAGFPTWSFCSSSPYSAESRPDQSVDVCE